MTSRPLRLLAAALVAAAGVTACSRGGPAPATTPAAVAPDAVSAAQLAAAGELPDPDATLDELCGRLFPDADAVPELRVGLMTESGTIADGTFNQFAYEGMDAAARCFGFDTTFVANGGAGDELERLQDLLDDGLDAVVTLGFELGDETRAVAADNPDVAFVGIDQTAAAAPDNYAMVTFRDDQAGFLAGALAGMLTASGTVGVVAGPDVPPVLALADGFEAGVAEVAPEVEVLRTSVPSFSDPDAGADAARGLVGDGVDVLFAPAGRTGSGAIQAAASAGRWVVGVDQDEYLTTFEGGRAPGAERIVSSAVKRVDLGVFLQLADVARGVFQGGPIQLDVATGGVTYAPSRAEVPADVLARLEELRVALADGTLDPAPR